ncbi:D-2-hydroxyglutarate dehydrogenase, mitochondrial isoform X2 [Frankliniella occidentalis]|uniref:D-2-hydroxyglutarate dehydrogenase, mitochondrial n=1 Tax=Frankliniella occidentalis TaxID=133901 RepID=A0A6J1T223_FRAOC|nr:D-2-hydroxyglutarate dehydrogenase, mitochondrial isoform X2 [Frankliniella occidentalis]
MRKATSNLLHTAGHHSWLSEVRCAKYGTASALTKDRYNVQRGNYATLTDRDVSFFEQIVGKSRILTDAADVEPYNADWLHSVKGYSQCVLKPKTTEEVSAILKYCNERLLAVCPQGGNSGLAGGSNPVFDEVVISTSLMNNILGFDSLSGVLSCQAGCILENLETHLEKHGHIMPLDLGAKGSCQIGGNVSTNAGGLRLVRYGSLHGSVLGVEAVLANGDVIDCMSKMKKDNTGYHLKHLFIGSEGTLGLVTKVAINCPVLPKSVNVALLGLESYEKVLETLKTSKRDLGEILSSCEMMDRESLQAVEDNLKLRVPIKDCPFYLLIETSGSNSTHDEEKLAQFLEHALDKNMIIDGTQASEPSRIKNLWELRENITSGLAKDGYCYKYDISLPHEDFYSCVEVLRHHLGHLPVLRVCGYGHIGDGNIHLNVTSKAYSKEILQSIEPFIYEWTAKVGGSVSAEHGIGFKKRDAVHFSKSTRAIELMHQMKKVMDPNGILNPYKVLPELPITN